MRMHGWRLSLVLLISTAACMQEVQVDKHLVDAVQVSKSEPGPWCRPLGAVEGGSDMATSGYVSAYQAVRQQAALLGGNYFVIDHVAGGRLSAEAWHETIIGGRVFACPTTAEGFARVHVMVPDPPEQVSDGNATLIRPGAVRVGEPQ